MRTHQEFHDWLHSQGLPAVVVVIPEDYEVIEQKFVHRHDRFEDGGGPFCVVYLPPDVNHPRQRPIVIRRGPLAFFVTADDLNCEP